MIMNILLCHIHGSCNVNNNKDGYLILTNLCNNYYKNNIKLKSTNFISLFEIFVGILHQNYNYPYFEILFRHLSNDMNYGQSFCNWYLEFNQGLLR